MVARILLYPFVLLLVYGNILYSESNHSPTFCVLVDHIEQQGYPVFIGQAKTPAFLEGVFQVIVEENSTDSQDDGNDASETSDTDKGLFYQLRSPVSAPTLLICHSAPAGPPAPLYLLNRVFRI